MTSPTLTIVRGHPGSGKTTIAQQIARDNRDTAHFENDQFFTKDGVYTFELARHEEAKAWCLDSVRNALAAGQNVVVSSTFTTLKEMQPYVDLVPPAQLKVVEMFLDFPDTHNVPPAVVAAKKASFEPFEGATKITEPVTNSKRPGMR